jgi:DNA invertase Pin-like site-specific DNA recombinase
MKQTVIYLRTSTEEQNPENQKKDCVALAEKLNLKDYEVLPEQQSAFKDNIKRDVFESIIKAIKKKEIQNLICWDLDRLYRNRQKLLDFFNFCKAHNIKVYSARQEFLNTFDNLNLPQGFEFLAEMYRNNFLQFLGWIAEEESRKKSERVKSAVRTDKGITKSYKGNKWGRKSLSKNTIKQVLELHKQGISMRQISKQVFYWDKNNNKKQIALSSVHKIITKNTHKLFCI